MSIPIETFFPEEISDEKRADMKHALQQLLASEGWKIYIGVIERQQVQRFNEVVLSPLPSADGVFHQEYMKGEIQGLRAAAAIPQGILEAIEYEDHLAKAQAEMNGDKGDHE